MENNMLNWYCDLVFEGKYRAIINAIFSILIIAVILAVAMTPDSAWEKIIDGDPARLEYLEYARAYRIVPILSVLGSYLVFIGFDVLRDEICDDALGYTRIACLVIGSVMIIMATLTGNALACGKFEHVMTGNRDIVAAALRAVPRFGLFQGLISLGFYAYVGLKDDYDSFLDRFAPLFPPISAILGFFISFGIAFMTI